MVIQLEKGIAEKLTSHTCLFVDDLKLFAPDMNTMKLLLDLAAQFSKDIGVKFWESRCAYLHIERGKRNVNSKNIKINNLNIQQVKEGELYRYLGKDENISFDSAPNKERVPNEYYKQRLK